MLVCNHRRKLSEGVLYLTVCRGKQDRIKIDEDEEAEALDFMNLRVDILQRGNVTVRYNTESCKFDTYLELARTQSDQVESDSDEKYEISFQKIRIFDFLV